MMFWDIYSLIVVNVCQECDALILIQSQTIGVNFHNTIQIISLFPSRRVPLLHCAQHKSTQLDIFIVSFCYYDLFTSIMVNKFSHDFPLLPILLPNTQASNIFAGSTFLAALNQLKRLFPSSIVFIFPQEEDILCFTLLPTPPRLSSHPSGKRSTEKRNTIPARLCWTSYSCQSVSRKSCFAIISTRCKCITLVADAQDLNYDTVSFGVFFLA